MKSSIRIDFDRKGTELVHLLFQKIHILLRKEGLPPFDHQKSYISVDLDQKGPEIMHIWLAKYKIFLGKGGAAPLQPPSGGQPPGSSWT